MPCNDWPPENVYRDEDKRQIKKLEAMLCMILTDLEGSGAWREYMSSFNFKEAGITKRELEDWWVAHKLQDIARKKREIEERARAQKKRTALAKLTPEERKLLGLPK